MITPLENFQRMMRHDAPQWLPLNLQATPPVLDLIRAKTGSDDIAAVFNLDSRSFFIGGETEERAWRSAYDRLGVALPSNASVSYCGITHAIPPRESVGAAYHLAEMLQPLATIERVEQLEGLPWPTPRAEDEVAIRQHVARAHAEGRFAVGGLECTCFETAWYLRGMENLFTDLLEGNPVGPWLLDRITKRSIDFVSIATAAGVDVISLGDDVGTQRGLMMSIDFWRTHLKPRLKQVIDAVRDAQCEHVYVRYHSDGDIRPIIEDLIEIGVDILNPIQPECMPVDEIIPRFRDRLAFWGIIGTQTTMPFGTPADVERAVEQCATLARDGAAIVVSPTHVLEPDVPWENIVALVEATKRVKLP